MNKKMLSGIILIFICLIATTAFCETKAKSEHVAAVQDRIFFKYHELDASLGYISDDDFYHLYPIGIGYTFNFNDLWSWNVADALIMVGFEKDLKGDLEDDFGATPSEFSKLKYAFHSNLIWKPLYGKDVFGYRKVINHETYLLIGGGVVVYEKEYSYGSNDHEVSPSISLGIGQKIFINPKTCLNFEIKDWINIRTDTVDNNFWVGISLGYRFDLKSRTSGEDDTFDKIDKYMD